MPNLPAIFVLCPHCASAFSITSQQLSTAMGAVRCGKCKKIFNAKFHQRSAEEMKEYLAKRVAYLAQQQAEAQAQAEAEYAARYSVPDAAEVDYADNQGYPEEYPEYVDNTYAYDGYDEHYADPEFTSRGYTDSHYAEDDYVDDDYPARDYLDSGYTEEEYSTEPLLKSELSAAFNPGFVPDTQSYSYPEEDSQYTSNLGLDNLAPTALEGDPLDETFSSQAPGEFDFSQLDEVPLEVLDLRQLDLTPEEEAKFHEVEINLDEWLAAADVEAKDFAEQQARLQVPPRQEPKMDMDLSNLELDTLNNSPEDLLTDEIAAQIEKDFLTASEKEAFVSSDSNSSRITPTKTPLSNESEDTTMVKKKNSKLGIIIFTLLLALAAGVGGTVWFINSSNQGDFKITKVSVNPTASQLQLRVDFRVTNTASETKILPTFEIHLLNLSDRTITKHLAGPSSLGAPNSGLQAGKSYDLNLTVERPNTLVKSAKVEIYQR